jgi:transposase-like protein
VDSTGATLDFLLTATQDAEAAKRFLAKALGRQNHPAPRVIHTDGHGAYPPAITQLKGEGALAETCRHRVGHYLNTTYMDMEVKSFWPFSKGSAMVEDGKDTTHPGPAWASGPSAPAA